MTFSRSLTIAALGLAAFWAAPSAAQQAPSQPQWGNAPVAKSPPAAQAKGKSPAPASAAAPAGGDVQLRQRVEQLEEQMVDLQVVIGTLESLTRTGGTGAASPSSSASGNFRGAPAVASFQATDVARIDGLETQIRALTAQVEQLSGQLRAQGGATAAPGRRSEIAPEALSPPPAPRSGPPQTVDRFGSTTVTSAGDGGDPIDGLLRGSPPARRPSEEAPNQRQALAPLPGEGGAAPKQLYESAYGLLLQQDYGAAEAAFDDFLRRHPADALAGNAQYWLGETYFVRGQYKQSAASFLKGYQTYGQSAKAPDSLLKLAMSLDRLGQKEAACASYSELAQRFPRAPQHVKNRADSERRRIGCA